MAAPSLQTLQTVAAQTGHQPGTIEKVMRLLDLLSEITADATLGPRFVLKGGTALNVFHLNLDRLSVDIDLNYIGALDRAKMLEERPDLEARLNDLLVDQGYAIHREPGDEHAGGKWVVRHASALGGNGSLEIDLNFMFREPLFAVEKKNSVKLGETQALGVAVLNIYEIIAGKLVALLDRKKARDLFDARRIMEIPNLDWDAIKTVMLAIGASRPRDWRTASTADLSADRQELKQKLAMCLAPGYFANNAAADAWITESIALCSERVKWLLTYSAGEKVFLDTIADKGEIDASGLSGDDSLRSKIARMPILLWKAQNVKQHLALQAKPKKN